MLSQENPGFRYATLPGLQNPGLGIDQDVRPMDCLESLAQTAGTQVLWESLLFISLRGRTGGNNERKTSSKEVAGVISHRLCGIALCLIATGLVAHTFAFGQEILALAPQSATLYKPGDG